MLKKAMIMAAGVGSRLGALSNVMPKPLVPLANIPVMDIIVNHLKKSGIEGIVANTYYKAENIIDHYKNDSSMNFVKEVELSGTAGGVKKCQFFFEKGQDFIVLSADGLSDINIEKAYDAHKKSGAIATLILKEVPREQVSLYGIVVPDEEGYVASFQEKPSIEEAKSCLANTGIYIFNYEIFNFIPENTFYDFAKNVFPNILGCGLKINTFIMEGYWNDIGSLNQYKQSNFDIMNKCIKSFVPNVVTMPNTNYVLGNNVEISEKVKFVGNCIVGHNCRIGKNVKLVDSILWDNVEILDDVIVENSIVLSDIKVKESLKDKIHSDSILSSSSAR